MELNKITRDTDESLSLDEYQIAIFNGLKEIGEEISTFYYDGVKIFRSNLSSKPYLLAHIAREIEGGIRDIFASDKKAEVQECPQCGTTKKQSSHIDEICKILGVDTNDKFADEWHKIAREFHKYAHRQGPWETTREKEIFNDLWKQFERKILQRLVGNYLNLLTLVDRVLSCPQPTKEILETLDNLLQNGARRKYFFDKLTSAQWFKPLLERGYFRPEEASFPKPADEEGHWIIPQWNILPYLEKVSQQVNLPHNEKCIDELLTIIKDVSNYKDGNNQHIDNYHTWWYFVKILCNLPTEKITNEVIDLISIWLESKFDNMLPAAEIVKKLLPNFLDSSSPDDWIKAERIVSMVTEIKWVPKYSEQYKKEIKEKYKDIFDKPEEQRTDEERLEIAFFDLDEYEPKTIVDTYWLVESFINKKIASKVGDKCSENVIYILANKLKKAISIKSNDKYDLSYIWLKSLFEFSGHISGVKETLTLILRETLLSKVKRDEETTKKIIDKFLSEDYKYPLFKRLVLFIIGTEWQDYQDIFWNMIDENGELFNDPHYEAEIYTILQIYGSQFSPEEKEKIKNIIETKVPDKPHPEEKYREYYSAYQRQKWYSAVKSDEYFSPLYEKYKNTTNVEEEISFREPEVCVGPCPSPLTKEAILKMSNKELAEYLGTFKTVDFWKGPTIDGLSDILKDAVQENPEKFIDYLNPFLKTGYLYVYDILWGIRDAWEKKKIINWGKLFSFIQEYIRAEDFWNDKYNIEGDDWKANHFWVVGMVSELIRQGTVDDAWTFSEEHFKEVQEILFQILDRMLSEKDKILSEQPVKEDFVGHALNSSLGKTTEALFMLALRIKRFEKEVQKKQQVSWEANIKDKYDTILNDEIVESYVWLGRYLPNFYYLDKGWTENKIKSISSERKQLWKAFMDGYLSGGRVYEELYILMKSHYENAINYQFKQKYFTDRLVQHICIGYLRGFEFLNEDSSLFRKLLDKWYTSQIKEVIDFFWMQRREREQEQKQEQQMDDEERAKIENKIIDFWRWVYENKYKGKQENELNNDDKIILSELCNLTVFLPEIDFENFKWLKISAWCVDISFHSSFFIEYLDELKDKRQSVEFVGKVYLELLKNATPDFRKENIQSIVKYLYDSKSTKQIEEAENICNIYSSQGYEFLRELYGQYKNRKTN